jgi:molecular chaperone HtpG
MTATTQAYEFRAEIQQLLNILVHSLYTDREIFLRELISNASDALNRLRFEMLSNAEVVDPEAELAIRIRIDKDARTITVSDTGIGMNRAEMIENLGTIARSGAMSFLEALKDRPNATPTDIIGQFGVGFYSVFMVADKVQVISRTYRPGDEACMWTSDGSTTYTIEFADKATRGTDIVIHVKEDAEEFLSDYRLESIVRKHSNYIAFPIYVGEKVANAQTALWRRAPREVTEAEYQDFYKHLTYDPGQPVLHVHLIADAPVQFYSLLYVPSRLDRGLFTPEHSGGPRLYARKVLIQEHAKDLLPEWMRFIEGVVDSEDLPLNISRETVQSNRVMARLRATLSGKLISEMESLASEDKERYEAFWKEFGRMIKEGIFSDGVHRDRLAKLLRFCTSRNPDGWVSLDEYVERMVEGQEHIYYLFGDDIKSIQRSPHLDVFRSHGVEVLFLVETIDSFMINALAEHAGKKFHNGADADIKLPGAGDGAESEAEAPADGTIDALVGRFEEVLGDRVSGVRVSRVLTENPARLVSPDQGFGADMERVYRMLDKDFMLPKRILEINPNHSLIRNLAAMGDDPLTEAVIEQLFESTLLIEGIHPNPVDMVPRIQKLMEAATRRTQG